MRNFHSQIRNQIRQLAKAKNSAHRRGTVLTANSNTVAQSQEVGQINTTTVSTSTHYIILIRYK